MPTITTYSKLIRGAAFFYNFCADKLDKTKDPAEKSYWLGQCAQHQETISRLVIARATCGDETVSIR